MLQTYEVILDNGNITWLDNPPNNITTKGYLTLLEKQTQNTQFNHQNSNTNYYDLNKIGEQRWGFLSGQAIIPDDIDWSEEEIAELFGI